MPQRGKFAICGKSRGILTASRSAEFASKFMHKCGRTMILRFPFTSSILTKIAQKTCIGMRFCYAYYEAELKKNARAHKESVRECVLNGTVVLRAVVPEMMPFTEKEFQSIYAAFARCFQVDLVPTDVSVMLGAIRSMLKAANLASSVF
ncbi:uncharacterized protein LOC144124023 [Amblyomma americanum]